MRFVKTAENLFGLPNGFKRVDYIQSTGTQYIDTGIKAKTGLTVEARLKYTTNTGIFCGAITTVEGSGDRFYPINFAQSGKVSFTYLDSAFSASTSLTSGNVYTIKTVLGATKQEMFVDGVSSGSTSKTNVVEINCTLGLFALHRGESYDVKWVSQVPATLYYFKIWDGDTLVRDFIPCIDPLGIPCLYDLVGKKTYYNQGTGEFTVGRQIIPVEYLESSGTQYIDTGLKGKSGISAKTKVNYTYLSGSASHAIGGEYTTNTSCYFGMVRANGHFTYLYKNSVVETTTTISTDTDYDIDITLNNGNQRFVINGNVVSTGTVSGDFTSTNNLFLYAINSVNGADVYGSLKMYYMQISDNGTLIRDYIPCKDENNVGFMFDTLSGTVYLNAGTGAFVVGQNKYKMKLRLIRDNILPTGYTQVEYLESSGTQWIDTGIDISIANTDVCKIITDFTILTPTSSTGINAYTGIFGAGSPRFGAYGIYDKICFGYVSAFDNIQSFNFGQKYNLEYTVTKGSQEAKLDGASIWTATNTGTLTDAYKLGLFCRTQSTVQWIQNARIYNFKFYDNGTLICDYIPAIDPSGTPCMYDLVSRTPFYNQGTGTFITGKPVLPVVRFIKDILPAGYKAVNYLQSTGTQYIDTGVYPTQLTEAEYRCAVTGSVANVDSHLFGSRLSASSEAFDLAYMNTTPNGIEKFRFIHGTTLTQEETTSVTASQLKNPHTYYMSGTSFKVYGSEKMSFTTASFTGSYSLWLFGVNNAGSLHNQVRAQRVYYCKIWNNNTIVRNFIPVVRLLDNKAGMWDTVTKQFYTTPVGDFITG